jgi:hypothetical protein
MPGSARKALGNGIVDEPRKLLDRHVVGRHREIGDRIGRGFRLEHLRLQNAVGQFAAHLVHRVLHLGHGGVDVGADLELHHRLAAAFRGGRGDRVHPGDGAHGGFHALGDLRLSISVGAAPGG